MLFAGYRTGPLRLNNVNYNVLYLLFAIVICTFISFCVFIVINNKFVGARAS